jgi:hypothetical protein
MNRKVQTTGGQHRLDIPQTWSPMPTTRSINTVQTATSTGGSRSAASPVPGAPAHHRRRGLSVSHGIAEEHGGELLVETRLGERAPASSSRYRPEVPGRPQSVDRTKFPATRIPGRLPMRARSSSPRILWLFEDDPWLAFDVLDVRDGRAARSRLRHP